MWIALHLCYRNVKNSLVLQTLLSSLMFSMERQFDVGLSEQLPKDCRGRATRVLAGRNGRNCIVNHAERGFPSAAGHRAIITGVFGDRGPRGSCRGWRDHWSPSRHGGTEGPAILFRPTTGMLRWYIGSPAAPVANVASWLTGSIAAVAGGMGESPILRGNFGDT